METAYGLLTGTEEERQRALTEAARILRAGGLVAFPTETVYGLGGNALSPAAAEKIYAAKGRPSDNPLIVHIARTEELAPLAAEIPDAVYHLAEAFWPGPLTMIVKKSERVPRRPAAVWIPLPCVCRAMRTQGRSSRPRGCRLRRLRRTPRGVPVRPKRVMSRRISAAKLT